KCLVTPKATLKAIPKLYKATPKSSNRGSINPLRYKGRKTKGLTVVAHLTSPRRHELNLSKNRRNPNTPRKAIRRTEGSSETAYISKVSLRSIDYIRRRNPYKVEGLYNIEADRRYRGIALIVEYTKRGLLIRYKRGASYLVRLNYILDNRSKKRIFNLIRTLRSETESELLFKKRHYPYSSTYLRYKVTTYYTINKAIRPEGYTLNKRTLEKAKKKLLALLLPTKVRISYEIKPYRLILDTRSSAYIYNNRSLFINFTPEDIEVITRDSTIRILGKGIARLVGRYLVKGRIEIILSDTLYLSRFYTNLVSYAILRKKGGL
ncbi:hypothetical protein N7524_003613, partial [Penicillium chrysogenum]